jgi:23S rRNA (cytidine2498-2'-O)-methyltransferase
VDLISASLKMTRPPSADTLVWVGYCRAGFERDLARELVDRLGGEVIEATENAGYVRVCAATNEVRFRVAVQDLTFARQLILTREAAVQLISNDRVTPIVDALQAFMVLHGIDHVVDCRVEYPDTNDGKALSRAAKAIEPRLRERLAANHQLVGYAKFRAMVFLTPDKQARIGLADLHLSANDPLGIPRFRMPPDAPSRSTLKLAEAIHVFLGSGQDEAMQPDMRAVDLGAAPGGWTWQLMQRGLRVTAVDNGALKGDLVDNAMVKHLRTDGFRYAPTVPVDWLVCDMVEQPARIATLVAKWLANGWARYAIFNLKLPMKKRHEEVARCREIIGEAMEEAGKSYILQLKQLYHDREEITGFVMLPNRKARFAHHLAAHHLAASDEARRVGRPAPTGRKTGGDHARVAASAFSASPNTTLNTSSPSASVAAKKPALNLSSTLPRAAASPWSAKPLPKQKKRR